ncbi:MAG: YidC/Oxa1 family membrane protein insertase [Clostridia bacterium]|nr:YidC/Oxa1 family membrane protein insertase [Clostridia bacterium]
MNYKKRTFAIRAIVLGLLMCVLLTTLVGCGSATKVTLTAKNISNSDANENGCTLDADLLNDIAQTLALAFDSTEFDSRELLIAAYRGYNMLDASFDDAVIDPEEVKETDMEAVHLIIETATDRLDAADRALVGKDYSAMTPADTLTVIGALQDTVDLDEEKDFWGTILGWIGIFLGWIDGFTGSYLVALIIFAIIVELLMLPLGIRQQKNSIRQAKLRPKEMAIRKKYAGRDDQKTQQKVSQEIQELYQKENFNPASGCLPLLLQLPIVLALYRIVIDPLQYVLGQSASLSSSLELYRTAARAAGGLGEAVSANSGTIGLLSKIGEHLDGLKNFLFFDNAEAIYTRMSEVTIPDFSLFGLNLGLTPSFQDNQILLIIPVLTFVVYYLTMKLTKKFTYQSTTAEQQTDPQVACSNKIMDLMMPIMSTWVCFMVPALVGIYWIFKSLISTLRQFIVSKAMPLPQFTEEDYKAAERELAGKSPKRAAAAARGSYSYPAGTKTVDGKPKSLFHMDDDDYVAMVEEQEKKDEEEAKSANNEKATAKAEFAAKLKDDKRDNKDNKKDKK